MPPDVLCRYIHSVSIRAWEAALDQGQVGGGQPIERSEERGAPGISDGDMEEVGRLWHRAAGDGGWLEGGR